ncbi:MAG: bifunctional folylpolyglutamate synthase/dihydrofolate synthase [Prevotellaceae bacterium]|nr:bifunctional folylpolyglutamate synthase/dihydrofolate synthase [Prevotellaceae bacterium]
MTYKEATDYLFNSAPLFQNVGKEAYKEGLDNTQALDLHFGHPHHSYHTIHVAGTNGKGSCSHTLAAILQEAGYRVGLYTSPHLTDFRERIRVNGWMIPEQRVVSFVEQERGFFEPLHPSFFELTTALALLFFKEQRVDVAVIEVGLGGRLDCTNVILPDLSVITNISYDHTQLLGNTLELIAREKAGIIKDGVPVVVGETGGNVSVRRVFTREARRHGSPIVFADEAGEVLSSRETSDGREYYTLLAGRLTGELAGLCQTRNTATILSSLRALRKRGYRIEDRDIARGFSRVCRLTGLRGRWQKVGSEPLTVCDTGHNPAGLAYIGRQLSSTKCERLHIVLGMSDDKDARQSLALLPKSAEYYLTQASVRRAMPVRSLAKAAREADLRGECFPSVAEAYAAAKGRASREDMIFVGGSSFVVADFLSLLSL